MIIRALSVFENVVYHSALMDSANPCRPTLEVDAVVRPGDADGPLLLPVAEYVFMAGGIERAGGCLAELRARGRIADHLGVAHVAFPFWTPIHLDEPGGSLRPSRRSGPGADGR